MPCLAFLEAPLRCPACGQVVTDEAWFAWGFCRGQGRSPDSTYVPGEAVRWRACSDGTTPSWTYFSGPDGSEGGNVGSAAVRDIAVRDADQAWLFEPCPSCGALLDGALVEIRDGVIVSGRLLTPGQLPAGTYLLPDGSGGWLDAGWDDEPMDVRTDC